VLLERRIDGSTVNQKRFAAARGRPGADQHDERRGARDSGPVGVRRQLTAAQPGVAGLRCWLGAGQHGHAGSISVAVRHHDADRPGQRQRGVPVHDAADRGDPMGGETAEYRAGRVGPARVYVIAGNGWMHGDHLRVRGRPRGQTQSSSDARIGEMPTWHIGYFRRLRAASAW